MTPALKMSSGTPYGRYFSVAGCSATVLSNCSNYGTQIVLDRAARHEAPGEHRDPRHAHREEDLVFADRAKVGLFLDIYNALNADTLVNINWRSGASFEKATTVVGPRILKFGVKFDW